MKIVFKIWWTSPDGFFGEEQADDIISAKQIQAGFIRQGCNANLEWALELTEQISID